MKVVFHSKMRPVMAETPFLTSHYQTQIQSFQAPFQKIGSDPQDSLSDVVEEEE